MISNQFDVDFSLSRDYANKPGTKEMKIKLV